MTSKESWPGHFDYFYPVVYAGVASDCRVRLGQGFVAIYRRAGGGGDTAALFVFP